MEGEMSEGTREEKSISSELTRLGKQVADAINLAWESEDRKKLQAEITTGLESFGVQVGDAMRKASESDAATQIRDQTDKVVAQVRQSDVTGEVRKGLIAGLEVLNKELGKLVERLEVEPQPAAPSAAESAGPAEPDTEPAEPPAPTGEV
jgi:molecular chaperone GrpE (heat shock protein)